MAAPGGSIAFDQIVDQTVDESGKREGHAGGGHPIERAGAKQIEDVALHPQRHWPVPKG
jgi:hypothetical protein